MQTKILDLVDNDRQLIIVKDEEEECLKIQSLVILDTQTKQHALRTNNYTVDTKIKFQIEISLYRKPENYAEMIVAEYQKKWEEKRI